MPDPADTGKNIKTTGTNVASEVNAGAGAKTLGKQPGTDPCANGGQGNGQSTSRGVGPTPGVYNGVKGDVKNLQPSIDKWNAAHADKGLKMHAFSGVGSRSVGASKHPSGNAVDVVIIDKNGCAFDNLWNGDAPAFRAYESFASQVCQDFNGRVGWGGNFGGKYWNDTMHFQNGGPTGQNGRVCEGKKNPTAPNNSQPGNTRYDGPDTCQEANGGQGESRGQGSDDSGGGGGCAEGGGGGCKPISSGAPAAAASMAQGQGLAANGPMGAALGAFGSNPAAAIQGAAQQALGGALGGGIIPNGAGSILGGGGIGSILSGGASNVLTQITSQVGSLVQNVGGGILPSLTGVVPSLFQGGNVTGLMTGVIKNQISGLIGAGLPNLGGFGQVFNTALSAAGSGADLKNVLLGSVTQAFGNAAQGALGNMSLPGFDITSKLTSLGLTDDDGKEGISDNLNFTQTSLKPLSKKTKDLTAPINEALSDLVVNSKMNGFSTMYNDYNSMITQGFGNLTNNMQALSTDMTNLGLYGDLTDLFNIGTPGQLVRQIIEYGLGIQTGVTAGLVERGLTLTDITKEENQKSLFELLDNINDPTAIDRVKKRFKMDDSVRLQTLADLLRPKNIFAYSYEFNNFEDLRDIALTLSICGGVGRLKTLNELGYVLSSLETAEDFTELLEEKQPIRIEEYVELDAAFPTKSYFGSNGPTVADFIGSLAGYVHNETLTRIDELLLEIYNDPVTDDLYDLLQLLTSTLSAPTIVNILGIDYVQVPTVGPYVFGDYLTLDDAISDIVDAIDYDLDFIKTLSQSDDELDDLLYELEALHRRSSEFLAHEQKMRSTYGIDFGESTRINNYRGDGSTISFPLYAPAISTPQVFVSGVQQTPNSSYSYTSGSNQVTFTSPPAAGSVISIRYEIDTIKPESRITDIWELANSLESLALETGHGSPADFLSRLVTNDYHGQRIMSVMMQSRNAVRLSNYGILCPAFNSILTDGTDIDKDVDFIDHTGIWTNDPSRAAEIWIQNAENVATIDDYILTRYKFNKDAIQDDLDNLMQNLTRQLIFYNNTNIAISDLMVEIYQENANEDIYQKIKDNLFVGFSDKLPTEGYVLGPYREILSKMSDSEKLTNSVFTTPISSATLSYLKSINIDLNMLITVCQRILMINGAIYLGLSEADFRSIFGVQSITKYVLKNLAMNY